MNIRVAIRTILVAAGALNAAGGSSNADEIGSSWTIHRLGLTDAAHLGSDLRVLTNARGLVNGPIALGTSAQFTGTAISGSSAWAQRAGLPPALIGLAGAEHQTSTGTSLQSLMLTRGEGLALGSSVRYAGDAPAGRSAWSWSALAGTTRLGFTDSNHTASDGFQLSLPLISGEGEPVVGVSARFVAGLTGGRSAWVNPAAGPQRIGIFDVDHTSDLGVQLSGVTATLADGSIVGHSDRYMPSTTGRVPGGRTAWLRSPNGAMERLGLVDAEHTGATTQPIQFSESVFANPAGYVGGVSTRYAGGTTSIGMSAWLRRPDGTTTRLGFIDAGHTVAGVSQWSVMTGLGPTGLCTGHSTTSNAGQSAWVYVSGDLLAIGLTDAAHTSSSNVRVSRVISQSDSGLVIGTSNRYNGTQSAGASAWVWSAAAGTQRIGLFDAEHTRADGFVSSTPLLVSGGGFVLGVSSRFCGSTDCGESAWIWSVSTGTRLIPVTGAQITPGSGRRVVTPIAVNASGQVIGTALRLGVSSTAGNQLGWFFDPVSNEVSLLEFASSTTAAHTRPEVITDAGTVLGSFEKYPVTNTEGLYAFAWAAQRGMVELGSLAACGLENAGWRTLGSIVDRAGLDAIVGQGTPVGSAPAGSQAAFLMVKRGCIADFNASGSVSVQDIFDFLTAFFAGCGGSTPVSDPICNGRSADINACGGVSVQDVFDFLLAWFLGC